jgi:hypothetical protein
MVSEVHCIHLGLHKTASTYLQRVGFPAHPEINLLPFRLGKPGTTEFLHSSWKTDDSADWSRAFQAEINLSAREGAANVISEENLSGSMMNGCNAFHLAHHIKTTFGSPKIIIVLREQFSYLQSAWLHHIREGGVVSAHAFLHRKASPAAPILYYGNVNIFDKVCYDAYIAELFRVFGKDRVKVVLYETMKADFNAFIKAIYQFIGVDDEFRPPNKQVFVAQETVTPGASGFVRTVNRLTRSDHVEPLVPLPFLTSFSKARRRLVRWACKLLPKGRMDMRALTPDAMAERIRISNQRLADMTGLDLASAGYLL